MAKLDQLNAEPIALPGGEYELGRAMRPSMQIVTEPIKQLEAA